MTKESTLCYIEKDGKYLMLHRTVKENDVNKDKWIGVGGHFEHGESPEECLLREVKEETGYTLTSWKYRGIVTFVYGEDTVEYMSLYTADGFEGEPIACDEGDLEWVEKERLYDLELWEGDKIFSYFGSFIRLELPAESRTFRQGGDEFVSIIPPESVNGDMEAFLSSFAARYSEKAPYSTSISYGWTLYEGSGKADFERLLSQADRAMYRMKKEIKSGTARLVRRSE